MLAVRERQAAAKADAIVAALDRVSDEEIDKTMRDLARALITGASRHRHLLIALLERLWPIDQVRDRSDEGPYTEPFE